MNADSTYHYPVFAAVLRLVVWVMPEHTAHRRVAAVSAQHNCASCVCPTNWYAALSGRLIASKTVPSAPRICSALTDLSRQRAPCSLGFHCSACVLRVVLRAAAFHVCSPADVNHHSWSVLGDLPLAAGKDNGGFIKGKYAHCAVVEEGKPHTIVVYTYVVYLWSSAPGWIQPPCA